MKILLVDDDAFNRGGVRLYLEQKEYEVIEASNSAEGWEKANETHIDGAIVDIIMPLGDDPKVRDEFAGVKLAIQLKEKFPKMGIVLFSAHEDRGEQIIEFVKKGHRGIGYKLKGCSPRILISTLKKVMLGHIEIDQDIINRKAILTAVFSDLPEEDQQWIKQTASGLDELSEREYEIARLLAASYAYKKIADVLHITPKTVENHITNIYKRLNFASMDEFAPHLRKAMMLTNAFWYKELEQ